MDRGNLLQLKESQRSTVEPGVLLAASVKVTRVTKILAIMVLAAPNDGELLVTVNLCIRFGLLLR